MHRRDLLSYSLGILCGFALAWCGPAGRAQSAPAGGAANAQSDAQVPASSAQVSVRITAAIDANNLVVIRGNVHPLAQLAFDQGVVQDSQPLHRMLLLLQRSATQETALRQFLDDQQNKSAISFQDWLTPEQFGEQFGPAAADVQTVSSWLAAHGFQVNRVSAGRTIIEFDGTAGQVRSAFHTEIHHYLVNGELHTANASDPQIPAALAPVVAGIVSLHNFPAKSHLLRMGTFEHVKDFGVIRSVNGPFPKALYTPPFESNTFPVVPADFGIIYNVTPLWNAGIDGSGQSIAVVGQTNIDVTDIQRFRTLFGLSNNFTSANVILDGVDPGVTGDETEADLDVEWSGAVAKNATIKFVVSAPTEVTGGTHLSALYIVDHNLAGVLSESYGECEQFLGATNNQFYSSLWEQAAAQGITVILSAGDGGSAGCDDFENDSRASHGIAVSGYASTPFNVAVGGTDFDEFNKWTQFWSNSNDPVTFASALGYIPETPWNDSCAQLGLTGCGTTRLGGDLINIVAGSGGPSTIYAKPTWQSGTGVPPDNKRDTPDVSLFASNGFNGSGYLVCQSDAGAGCLLNGGSFGFQQIGGTSASAPAFAGIMALINHSQAKQNLSNRQGNANYVLYALAKKQSNTTPALNCNASANPVSSCTFHDITGGNSFLGESPMGNNSVPCIAASTNCSSKAAPGILISPSTSNVQTPAWTTNSGYDMATGLGSVNAQNLASNWQSANSVPTSTMLSLNGGTAVNITHGSAVNVSIAVSPKASVGQAALVAATPGGGSMAVGQFTLANGVAAGTTSSLPGGSSYSVSAHYEGDGTNAPSDSPSVTVSVAPEASKTLFTVPTFDPSTGRQTGNMPSSLPYGSPFLFHVDVTNAAGSLTQLCASVSLQGCPSGMVTITDAINGGAAKPLDGGTFALNSAGYTEDKPVQLGAGSHVLTAQYDGDASYQKSSSTYNLTISPASTSSQLVETSGAAVVGQPFSLLTIIETPAIGGAVPSGTVTFFDGDTQLPGTVGLSGIPGGSPELDATITASISTGGTHVLTAKYSGDANYAACSSTLNLVVLYPTTSRVTLSPPNVVYGSNVVVTGTITTTNKSPLITGQVIFFSNNTGMIPGAIAETINTDANGNTQIVATVTYTPKNNDLISVVYQGDANFAVSSSSQVPLTVTTPDFNLTSPPTVLITAGQTGTATLSITPLSNLSSAVMLTCGGTLPSGSTCMISPAQVNLANGIAGAAMVSITSVAPSAASGSAMVVAQHKAIVGPLGDKQRTPPTRPPWIAWSLLSIASVLTTMAMLLARAKKPRRNELSPQSAAAGRGLAYRFEPYRALKAALTTAGLAVFLLSLATFAWSCGGGGGGFVTPPPPPPPPQLAPTTTSIGSATPKVAPGAMVTFTANVASTKSVTGSVQFFVNGGAIGGSVPLVNGSAQMQIVAPTFPGGSGVTAVYSGDANNAASTSPAFSLITTGSTSFFVSAQTGVNFHQVNFTATIQ